MSTLELIIWITVNTSWVIEGCAKCGWKKKRASPPFPGWLWCNRGVRSHRVDIAAPCRSWCFHSVEHWTFRHNWDNTVSLVSLESASYNDGTFHTCQHKTRPKDYVKISQTLGIQSASLSTLIIQFINKVRSAITSRISNMTTVSHRN